MTVSSLRSGLAQWALELFCPSFKVVIVAIAFSSSADVDGDSLSLLWSLFTEKETLELCGANGFDRGGEAPNRPNASDIGHRTQGRKRDKEWNIFHSYLRVDRTPNSRR